MSTKPKPVVPKQPNAADADRKRDAAPKVGAAAEPTTARVRTGTEVPGNRAKTTPGNPDLSPASHGNQTQPPPQPQPLPKPRRPGRPKGQTTGQQPVTTKVVQPTPGKRRERAGRPGAHVETDRSGKTHEGNTGISGETAEDSDET